MENITKALQDLAKAVESNNTVQNVKVTITLKKPTFQSLVFLIAFRNQIASNAKRQRGRKLPPLISPIIAYLYKKVNMPDRR